MSLTSLADYPSQLDMFVKSIFNVIIFKKCTDNVGHLRKLLLRLLRLNDPQITKCVLANVSILFSWLRKGKQVERPILTLNQMMRSSSELTRSCLGEYLALVAESKNAYLVLVAVRFVGGQFNENNLGQRSDGDQIRRIILESAERVLANLGTLEFAVSKKQSKWTVTVRN